MPRAVVSASIFGWDNHDNSMLYDTHEDCIASFMHLVSRRIRPEGQAVPFRPFLPSTACCAQHWNLNRRKVLSEDTLHGHPPHSACLLAPITSGTHERLWKQATVQLLAARGLHRDDVQIGLQLSHNAPLSFSRQVRAAGLMQGRTGLQGSPFVFTRPAVGHSIFLHTDCQICRSRDHVKLKRFIQSECFRQLGR